MSADTLSVLRHASRRMTKLWKADGTITPYDEGKYFTLDEVRVQGIVELSVLLGRLEHEPQSVLVRGKWVGAERARLRDVEGWTDDGLVRRAKAQFDDQALHTVLVDIDAYRPVKWDPIARPEDAIIEFVMGRLPPAFWGRSFHWQLSSSAGSPGAVGVLKAHVWFWLREPATSAQMRAWARGVEGVDAALMDEIQIHYTAAPLMGPGVADPVPEGGRSGFYEGLVGDDIPLDLSEVKPEAESVSRRDVVLRGVVSADPVAQALVAAGLVRSQARGGELNITCPFAELHTAGAGAADGGAGAGQGGGGADGTSTQYFPAHTRGFAKGNFKCLHAHCQGRARAVWLARLGIVEGLDASAGAEFGPVAGDPAPGGGVVASQGSDGAGARAGSGGVIPGAKHLCTDQANANRLAARFKGRVPVAGGNWYAWDGQRWKQDERDVYANACQLSAIVKAEADGFRARVGAELAANEKWAKLADALDKWSTSCEMKRTIEAAIGLVKKILSVEVGSLDADPWLLNCTNGTVDLRTGALRAHRPGDFITKLAGVPYVAGASSALWRRVMAQITLEAELWGDEGGPMCAFLQRWFGYCATGLVREQVFVVHHGDGSNGKSTVLEVVAAALGDYASSAAPGLLTASRGERHPTEIADLAGRRMVTAHETGEGCVLREDFIKQATGGDILKARVMRGDFFDFKPTHKLQLLTNHKPIIRGQDSGIWRRVLLVPYLARFGSRESVAAGDAHFLKDMDLMAKLLEGGAGGELSGVLAWIVAGAVAWAAEGLKAPDTVLAASKAYQSEQDRIGAFLGECCELGPALCAPMTAPMGDGLYAGYTSWCRSSGVLALSRQRFVQELERAVPQFAKREEKQAVAGGRRSTLMIYGLRFLPDE